MRIAVTTETSPGERRVALVPDNVVKLVRDGHEVRVEHGAGAGAGIPDPAYASAGAILVAAREDVLAGAAIVARVRPPDPALAEAIPPGAALVALLAPDRNGPLLARLAARGVTALALERVPRITRAQAMDVLSSQASIAGYKAVLLGAAALPRILPMMTTAAGTLAPARVFVLGAGVAGLQAIATARRLGGVVSAYDVRAAAAEQVRSLGATFVATPEASAEGRGGYAQELGAAEQQRVLAAVAAHLPSADLVVTTALVPGRPAPRLITLPMLATLRPGSVVVDLAADAGGNCEATVAGETVTVGGVTVIAAADLAATVPFHASQMFGRNVAALLAHVGRGGALTLDPADEIVGPMLVVHGGEVRG
jgi:NAD(P) transhydrogenase subunit alpha